MGLGKSFQSLLYAEKRKRDRPVIIVCPAHLKWNWERECSMHIGVSANILHGTKVPSKKPIQPAHFYIINYDILKPWLKWLRRLRPKLIVIDECHFAKNSKAIRTRMIRALCKGVKRIIAMSGTPLTNRPYEMWVILNLLRPDIFDNKREFAHRYCDPELTRWGWQYNGATHLDELHDLLNLACMIRRLKTDVLKDLPPKSRYIVPVQLERRSEYNEALADLIKWLRKTSPKRALRAKRAQAIVKTGYLLRLAAELKLKAVIEWIDEALASGKKLLLFAIHRKIISALHEKYKGISVVIDGKVHGHQRQLAVDQFNKSKKTRLCIAQLVAGGVGWNCRSSSTIVFVEEGWVPALDNQAEDRAHGLKRGLNGVPLDVYHLVAKDTVEEKLCKVKREKQKNIKAVLDGGHGFEDYAAFDLLINSLTRKGNR